MTKVSFCGISCKRNGIWQEFTSSVNKQTSIEVDLHYFESRCLHAVLFFVPLQQCSNTIRHGITKPVHVKYLQRVVRCTCGQDA